MIPASLQTIKDQARSIADETSAEHRRACDERWQALLTLASAQLGELWQYADQTRPTRLAEPLTDYAFAIRVPGHKIIYAWYSVVCSGFAHWVRNNSSGRPLDVGPGDPDGRANWIISTDPRKWKPWVGGDCYHTLGAALLAAEEK